MKKVHKFHAGLTETAIGPAIGGVFDLLELGMKARDGALGAEDAARLSDFINFGLWNNPVFPLNLFYVRPALDFLILNAAREVASPGYMKRSLRQAKVRTQNRNTRFWNREKKDGGMW
jgi:hypothetical protein